MIRAALLALALASPAHAATTDLTMTIVDGRPVFRPADGLDCYSAKFGGMAIDCAFADAALMRPRRAPCWIRPDLVGACPPGEFTLAALPPQSSTFTRPGRNGYDSPFPHRPAIIGSIRHHRSMTPHDTPSVPSVPLPGTGELLAAIAAMALWGRRRG